MPDRENLTMRRAFVLLAMALLAGCSTVTYRHGSTSIVSTSFAITREIGHIEIADETGRAIIDQAKTDEVQAISAAVEGAIKGVSAGAKP